MIWGNLIIFCLVVIIVCLVDFSTIALDESTKQLLYLEVEGEEKTDVDSKTESSEEVMKEQVTSEQEGSANIPGVESGVWFKKKTEVKKKSKTKKSTGNTKNSAESVEMEKSKVGMGLDFDDDFNSDFAEEFAALNESIDTDSVIDEIYSKGGAR